MPPSDPQLNKVRLGNPRVTGKEQFYTPPEIADQVMRNVKKRIGDLSGRILLEPAGGTGAFIDAAKAHGLKKVISFDIEPHHQKITLGDFLDQEINQKGLLTVTNPPFGRNNSLSIPFFNKAAQVSDLIVFVVPRSWRKWSVQNRLDQSFHLVRDDDLTINYVDVNGHDAHAKNRLRTCVQYWERKTKLRPIVLTVVFRLIKQVACRKQVDKYRAFRVLNELRYTFHIQKKTIKRIYLCLRRDMLMIT